MSNNSNNRKAEATGATAGANLNPDKVVKTFLVGYCTAGISPIFAEAATENNSALAIPDMDDSRDGLRFVGRNGQEQAHYIPVMTTCYTGAMTEIKKYLYDVDVIWAPQGVDKNQLTRDRACKGPVEEALDNFLRSKGARPSLAMSLGLI